MAVIFGCVFVIVAILTGYTMAGGKIAVTVGALMLGAVSGVLTREISVPVRDFSVTATAYGSADTVVALGHGAGGDRKTPLLVRLASALAGSGRGALRTAAPAGATVVRPPARRVNPAALAAIRDVRTWSSRVTPYIDNARYL